MAVPLRDLREAAVREDRVVNVYVCGEHFRTSWETLTWVKDSKMAKYFASNGDRHRFFFDHDPDVFRVILSALRRRKLPQRPASIAVDLWNEELKFWGLEDEEETAATAALTSTTPSSTATKSAPAVITPVAASTSASPAVPVVEVPSSILVQFADASNSRHNPHQLTPPYRAPTPTRAEEFAKELWVVIIAAQKLGITSVPYRTLRRAHWIKEAIGMQPGERPEGSVFNSQHLHRYVLRTFVMGHNVNDLDCVPENVFAPALQAVFKAFTDQRINPDLRFEVSTTGCGEDQLLHLKYGAPK